MKKFLILFFLFSISSHFFCNEQSKELNGIENKTENNTNKKSYLLSENEKSQINQKTIIGKRFFKPKDFKSFLNQVNFNIQMGSSVYINTQSPLVSAPSPILFPISVGFTWPNYVFLAIQPSITFFILNSLWHNDMALPAEIENRTATSYCLFFNIPASFSLYLKQSKIQLSVGAGILLPITSISTGVSPNDSGTSGSAESDVLNIQNFYFSKGRIFYLTTELSWLFDITNKMKIGPVVGAYFPLGSFINNEGFSRFMGHVGIKIGL